MKLDLTNHDDYLIASAVRGPDFQCGSLKYILTGAIRYMGGMRSSAGAVVRECPLSLENDDIHLITSEIVSFLNLNTSGAKHYLMHCIMALERLSGRGYEIEPLIKFTSIVYGVAHMLPNERSRAIKDALETLTRAEQEAWWGDTTDMYYEVERCC